MDRKLEIEETESIASSLCDQSPGYTQLWLPRGGAPLPPPLLARSLRLSWVQAAGNALSS